MDFGVVIKLCVPEQIPFPEGGDFIVTSLKMGPCLRREALKGGKVSKMPRDGQLGIHSHLAHSSTLHPEEATFFPVSFSFTLSNGARLGRNEEYLLASRRQKILALSGWAGSPA